VSQFSPISRRARFAGFGRSCYHVVDTLGRSEQWLITAMHYSVAVPGITSSTARSEAPLRIQSAFL
jgi:hypothetical protein